MELTDALTECADEKSVKSYYSKDQKDMFSIVKGKQIYVVGGDAIFVEKYGLYEHPLVPLEKLLEKVYSAPYYFHTQEKMGVGHSFVDEAGQECVVLEVEYDTQKKKSRICHRYTIGKVSDSKGMENEGIVYVSLQNFDICVLVKSVARTLVRKNSLSLTKSALGRKGEGYITRKKRSIRLSEFTRYNHCKEYHNLSLCTAIYGGEGVGAVIDPMLGTASKPKNKKSKSIVLDLFQKVLKYIGF